MFIDRLVVVYNTQSLIFMHFITNSFLFHYLLLSIFVLSNLFLFELIYFFRVSNLTEDRFDFLYRLAIYQINDFNLI